VPSFEVLVARLEYLRHFLADFEDTDLRLELPLFTTSIFTERLSAVSVQQDAVASSKGKL
jgi:hypothetical protein